MARWKIPVTDRPGPGALNRDLDAAKVFFKVTERVGERERERDRGRERDRDREADRDRAREMEGDRQNREK